MEDSLDQKAQQARTKEPIPNVDYTHFVHYDIRMGFRVCVLGVFGLPGRVSWDRKGYSLMIIVNLMSYVT